LGVKANVKMQRYNKKFLGNFIIFLIIIITIGNLITYSEYQNLFLVTRDIQDSGQTLRAANQAIISLHEAGMEISAYLLAGDADGMKKFSETITSVQLNLDALKPLVQDTKEQAEAFNEITPLMQEKNTFFREINSAYEAGNKELLLKIANSKARFELTNSINQKLFIIKKIEMDQLIDSRTKLHTDIIIANILFMLTNIISIALLIFYFFKITHDGPKS
jgi:CHASE3 domain sensor protein